MNIKYCYNSEIRKTFSPPTTFNGVLSEIKTLFEDTLPKSFSIQYKDNDGDVITISSDLEYRSMLRFDAPSSQQSFKLFIIPSSDDKKKAKILCSTSKSANGSFEVINSSQSANEGGVSEFSLTSDEGKASDRERSPSASSRTSKIEEAEENQSENENKQPSQIEEPLPSNNDTLNQLYEARASIKEYLKLGSQDFECSVQKQDMENSLENILENIEPLSCKNFGPGKVSVREFFSLENSILAKEIDQATDELAAKKVDISGKEMDKLKELKKPLLDRKRVPLLSLDNIDLEDFDQIQMRRREENIRREQQSVLAMQEAAEAIQKTYHLKEEHENQEQSELSNYYSDIMSEMSRRKRRTNELFQQALRGFQLRKELQDYFSNKAHNKSVNEATNDHVTSPFENKKCWDIDYSHSQGYQDLKDFSFDEKMSNKVEETPTENVKKDSVYESFERCQYCENGCSYCQPSIQLESNTEDSRLIAEAYSLLKNIPRKVSSPFAYEVILNADSSVLYDGYDDQAGIAYKTISIKNNGPTWNKCSIRSIGHAFGRTVELYNVESQQTVHVTLELTDILKFVEYTSRWRLFHEDENGIMEPIGEPFGFDFIIETKKEQALSRGIEEDNHEIFENFVPKNFREDDEEEQQAEDSCFDFDSFKNQHEPPQNYVMYHMLKFPEVPAARAYMYQVTINTNTDLTFCQGFNGTGTAFQTIYIENTGTKPWNRCYLRSIGPVCGKSIELYDIRVGQVVPVTLELMKIQKFEPYTSRWRLIHENQNGMIELIGEPFEFEFTIGNKDTRDAFERRRVNQAWLDYHPMSFEEEEPDYREDYEEEYEDEFEPESDEGEKAEPKEEGEQEENDEFFAKYISYREEAARIAEIRRVFPLDSLDEITEFVNHRPDLNMEELLMAYFTMRNEC